MDNVFTLNLMVFQAKGEFIRDANGYLRYYDPYIREMQFVIALLEIPRENGSYLITMVSL